MYRIEVATGEETVFRTVEELATGIRNGLITPRCRIYHAASQKWLPIEFHPHYKKAVELVTGGAPVIDTGETRVPQPAAPRRPPALSFSPVPTPPPAAAFKPAPPTAALDGSEPPLRPKPMPWESPTPTREPVAAPAPVVDAVPAQNELPKITYPEVTAPEPAEPPHPVARRRAGGRGSTVLGGLVLVAVIGGWIALHSSRSAAASPAAEQRDVATESEFGDEPAFPEEIPPSAPAPSSAATPTPTPPVKSAAPRPAPPAPTTPTSTVRPLGPVSQAWSSSAGAIAVTPSPAAATPKPALEIPAISPPPAELDLSVGKLPSADSLASRVATRDSGAISRILKAVSDPAGTKKSGR